MKAIDWITLERGLLLAKLFTLIEDRDEREKEQLMWFLPEGVLYHTRFGWRWSTQNIQELDDAELEHIIFVLT